VKLFNTINKYIILSAGKKKLSKKLEIINDNSAKFLQQLKPGQIGSAITSPPYYNAREYSQWSNMILYFVDMLINCKAVYGSMADNAYYLYNIGDIVSEDNVYVVSNMSKRRVQLGFLSCMIFEMAGYNLTGNIIWDKGEVQSKRNSTLNLFPGYVKCINCFEHVLVFRKGEYEKLSNSVERISPVIKINNKGENTYKHTAPYPVELVDLLRPYVIKDLYVLDPFLGSGTTMKWCKENDLLGLGIEMNEEYYNLCLKNLK
jgi:DNA modification methylase